MQNKLQTFVEAINETLAGNPSEEELLDQLKGPFGELIAKDDWLEERYAQPHPDYYQQHLMHLDPQERFSVVSFVWGPGQKTPVHNHTVWGMVGMLRGAEISTRYAAPQPGTEMQILGEDRLEPGMMDLVS